MARAHVRGALRGHPLFAAFDDATFEDVLRGSRVTPVSAGKLVFQRGAPATRFFILLEGAVNLVLHSRLGDEKVVETLRTGSCFAETLLFEDDPVYATSAVVVADAVVLAVPSAAYRAALEGSALTCLHLLTSVSRRVDALVREVEAQSLTDARTRIVRHVLELAATGSAIPSSAVELKLPEPKRRLAARLGIAPETLSRTFRALRNAGLMAVHGQTIRIDDLDRLRAAG
jgi:CRP/FNR family transcriptional regulator